MSGQPTLIGKLGLSIFASSQSQERQGQKMLDVDLTLLVCFCGCDQKQLKGERFYFAFEFQTDTVLHGREDMAAVRDGRAVGAGVWLVRLHLHKKKQKANRKLCPDK